MTTTVATTTITAARLSKRFDNGADVLRGAVLNAAGGQLTLIRGAAGSGRTTLTRCLTGVYRPDAGEVTLRLGDRGEADLTGADPRAVAWLRAHHIATFDGPLATAPTLPAQAAVARAARCSSEIAAAGLARLDAAEVALTPLGRLRSPQRHLVALTAALLADRPFVVLDRPDEYAPHRALATWLLEATTAGAAVIVTAAADSPLASIASAVGELRQGEIAWQTV